MVCELTNLTDRTIRYYIEEGLISPNYTENYIGRRTFDFSEDNVNFLKDVAVLRKYGFAVGEIKTMVENPASIPPIIENLKSRKQKLLEEEKLLLEKINNLTVDDVCNASRVAKVLGETVENKDAPKDEMSPKQRFLHRTRNIAKTVIVNLPIILFILGANFAFTKVKYPVIQWVNVIIALLMITPSLIIRFVSKSITKKSAKRLLLSLCVFCSFFTFIFSYFMTSSASITTSFSQYGVFYEDEYHLPIDPDYVDLFRAAPTEFYEKKEDGYYYLKPDAHYYYCFDNNWNNVYGDIYAEWSVSKETLQNEILRVRELFSYQSDTEQDETFYVMKKGDWNCIVKNDPPFYPVEYGDKAFEPNENGDYRYYIFAYNEKELRVRYIAAYGEGYRDGEPYYMILEW